MTRTTAAGDIAMDDHEPSGSAGRLSSAPEALSPVVLGAKSRAALSPLSFRTEEKEDLPAVEVFAAVHSPRLRLPLREREAVWRQHGEASANDYTSAACSLLNDRDQLRELVELDALFREACKQKHGVDVTVVENGDDGLQRFPWLGEEELVERQERRRLRFRLSPRLGSPSWADEADASKRVYHTRRQLEFLTSALELRKKLSVPKPLPAKERAAIARHIRRELDARFKRLYDAFEDMDRHRDGGLSRGEFGRGLLNLGIEGLDRAKIRRFAENVDTNRDGKITYQEFWAAFICDDHRPLWEVDAKPTRRRRRRRREREQSENGDEGDGATCSCGRAWCVRCNDALQRGDAEQKASSSFVRATERRSWEEAAGALSQRPSTPVLSTRWLPVGGLDSSCGRVEDVGGGGGFAHALASNVHLTYNASDSENNASEMSNHLNRLHNEQSSPVAEDAEGSRVVGAVPDVIGGSRISLGEFTARLIRLRKLVHAALDRQRKGLADNGSAEGADGTAAHEKHVPVVEAAAIDRAFGDCPAFARFVRQVV